MSSQAPGPDATAADIEADIEATRERLGASVEELVDRVNIPGRAKEKAQQATGQAKQAGADAVQKVKGLPPTTLAAAGAGLAAVIALIVIVRARR